MSNYLALTVMKQFSNSATLLALLDDFDQWVDVGRYSDEFLANVWDISTAQGFGLDIWGRILGQSRYLQIEQTPGNDFGFNINPASGTINAINQEFGVGDGSTVAFQLKGPDHRPATTGVVITGMTRQDWQGVQPIFNTARTNLVPFSQTIGGTGWSRNNVVATPNAAPAPDGTTTMSLLTATGSSNRAQLTASLAVVTSTVYTAMIWVAAGTTASSSLQIKDSGLVTTIASQALNWSGGVPALGSGTGLAAPSTLTASPNGAYLLTVSFNSGASTGVNPFVIPDNTATGKSVLAWGMDIKIGAPTSYIATAGTAVTVTDWSVNGTGLVTLAQTPVGPTTGGQPTPGGAAVLRWNGSYTGTIVGTNWQPWSQAPFYGGAAAGTTAFPLQDDYYRQLLLVKAAANIASSDCPSINALMRSMFGDRGRCYVGYDPANPMHIGYHFEFFPTAVEKSIIESGLFPQPAGTTAEYIYETLTYAPFGFAGANRGADPKVVTGFSQNPFYQP